MRIAGIAIMLALAPTHLVAQDTYTHIASAVELPNGSVTVLDDREREVWLLNPALDHRERLVTSGAGPGEARIPMWLVPSPAGSVMLWDAALTRVTKCMPGATPQCTSISLAGEVMPALQLLGADNTGRTFHVSFPSTKRREPPNVCPPPVDKKVAPDSSTIERFDPATRQFTPVARIEWGPTFLFVTCKERTEPKSLSINTMIMPVPFVAGDQIEITSTGEVVAVPGTGKELIRFEGGNVHRVPLQPPRPAQLLLDAERDSVLMRADSNKTREAMEPGLRDSKGAFRPGSLTISPASNLWIGYYEASKSTRRRYDGYALSGKKLGEVDLALNCRIVGVGRKVYYTVCKDEDDLETLAAVPLPAWEK